MGVTYTDRLAWIKENLKIIDKDGQLVPLKANEGQLILFNTMNEQRGRGLPVRIALLKPRQVGWTTWTEAEGFYDVYHRKNWNAMAVSMDTDSTDVVFGMTKLFHQEMPNQRATDNTNRKEIVFSKPHRSRFVAQTAGKVGVGRSFRSQYLHCSEVAFWQNAKEQLAGLYQIVPERPETAIILETTANGVGGAFYDTFWEAVERHQAHPDSYRGFLPVFFPWYRFSEYAIEPTSEFWITDEEHQIAQEFGLTKAQMYWRKLKIEEVNGDVALFKQEYPATALEAFQASGNPVFTQTMIRTAEARASKQPRYCIFARSDGIENVDRRFNCWQVRELVRPNDQYCIGIDTMEGRLSDVQNPKSNLDCDGIVVLDRTRGEIVAAYHGRGTQVDLANQVLYACRHYNDAWVAPEIPNSMVVLNLLKEKGYENIYNRQIHDERVDAVDSENLGWRTNLITRKWLVDDFIKALREDAIIVGLQAIIDEMKTFIRDKSGKPIHMPGKHDDVLFAAMIALQVHQRCPLSATPYPYAYTGNAEPKTEPVHSAAYSGGVDDWMPEDDEDDYFESHTY